MSDQETANKIPLKVLNRIMPQEFYTEKENLKKAVDEKVKVQLARLDPFQRLTYDFIFNNIFVDDNMVVMLISLRDELVNGKKENPLSPLYNFVSGWVHGLIDSVKGNKNLSSNEANGHFIRSMIDQVGFNPLVEVHINIMCEFVWTKEQIKSLERKYHDKSN